MTFNGWITTDTHNCDLFKQKIKPKLFLFKILALHSISRYTHLMEESHMDTVNTFHEDDPINDVDDIPMFNNEQGCDTQIPVEWCSDEQNSDENSEEEDYSTEYSDTGEYSGEDFSDEEYTPLQTPPPKTPRMKTNVWPIFRMPVNKPTAKKPANKKTTRLSHPRQPKNFTCKVCAKSFDQINKLKRHENIHLDVKPYACSECGKRFSQSANCNTHMDSVHKKMKHTCKICKSLFSNISNLGHHMDSVHGYAPRLCCALCNTMMSGDMARHLRTKRCKKLALELELERQQTGDLHTFIDCLDGLNDLNEACNGANAP